MDLVCKSLTFSRVVPIFWLKPLPAPNRQHISQGSNVSLTTPPNNAVGRQKPLPFEPIFVMIDVLGAICERYSYHILHKRLLYIRTRGVARGLRVGQLAQGTGRRRTRKLGKDACVCQLSIFRRLRCGRHPLGTVWRNKGVGCELLNQGSKTKNKTRAMKNT